MAVIENVGTAGNVFENNNIDYKLLLKALVTNSKNKYRRAFVLPWKYRDSPKSRPSCRSKSYVIL